MLKHLMIAGAILAAPALAAPAAAADEIWDTPIGVFIYERDLGDTAVLSYPLKDGPAETVPRGLAYMFGLGGLYEGRTRFEGIWVEPDDAGVLCPVAIESPDGEISTNWGRLEMVFADPDFPGTWVAMRGDCFENPESMIVGRPITALDIDVDAEDDGGDDD